MLGFVIFLLCVFAALGLLRFARPRRGTGRLRVVPASGGKAARWSWRVQRGRLDRKDLYYDPKQFRRRR